MRLKLFQSIGLTFVSRVVGFLRLIVETSLLGLSGVTDAYQAAFRLTNFFREFFGEGAMGSVFIPMHAKCTEIEDTKSAQNFFWCVVLATVVSSTLIVVLLLLNLDWLIKIWMPDLPQKSLNSLLSLTPLMLPYLIFIAVASLFMVMHQIQGRFIFSSIHPIIFSLSVITIGLWNPRDNVAESLACGVTLGGINQLILLSLTIRLRPPEREFVRKQIPRLKKLTILLLPILVALLVNRTNRLVDLFFASGLSTGSLSALAYSFILINVPMGLISAASNAVFYPIISKLKAENKHQDYEKAVISNLNFLTLYGSWAVGLLIFNSSYLVEFLFITSPKLLGISSQFDYKAAVLMSESLQCYSIGLSFLILNPYLVRLYHSHLNTSFPARIAILMVLFNFMLNWHFTPIYQHQGIALATSVVALTYFTLLLINLNRLKYLKINFQQVVGWFSKLLLSLITFLFFSTLDLPFAPFLQILLGSLIYFSFWHLVELKSNHDINPLT